MKADIVVDARYRSCPGPLISLAEAAMRANPGQVVLLLATDPTALKDVGAWALQVGHKVLKAEVNDDTYYIYLEV